MPHTGKGNSVCNLISAQKPWHWTYAQVIGSLILSPPVQKYTANFGFWIPDTMRSQGSLQQSSSVLAAATDAVRDYNPTPSCFKSTAALTRRSAIRHAAPGLWLYGGYGVRQGIMHGRSQSQHT